MVQLLSSFFFFGSHRKKLVKNCSIAASCEAGVYRIVATGIIIKGWHQTRYQPHAVWHRHGARVALVRWPIPRDGGSIIPEHVGGHKALNSKVLLAKH